MPISRGQWLTAFVIALLLHLLVLAAMRWSSVPETPPSNSPKGVMITLDDFDSGPSPPTSIDNMPIENLHEVTKVSEPKSPAAATAPEAATNAGTTSVPQAAAPIGPEAASNATQPTIAEASPAAIASAGGGVTTPETAPTNSVEPNATQAAITAAVSVHPDTTLSEKQPDQQVIARDATNLPLPSAKTTATGPGNGAYGNSEEATNAYIVKLRAWLSRYKRYPQQARSNNRQGTVKLYIAVDASGHVLEHRIVQSSGVSSLDQAAQDMLTRAEPLPAIPAAAKRNRMELVIPIVFTLH